MGFLSKAVKKIGNNFITKSAKKVLAPLGKKTEGWISDSVPHQHSAERRASNQAVSEQIDYYQKAKEEIVSEKKRAEVERTQGKKKIAKKQIRNMQHAYRSPGFLEETSGELGNKLG